MKTRVICILPCIVAAGCRGDQLASELGRQLFSDPKVSTSPFNAFSCSTCHQVGAAPRPSAGGSYSARIDPGYDLFNVVHRPAWWGGYVTRLLDAMNYCIGEFMGGRTLTIEDAQARELYEYLYQNSPDNPAPSLPLTVVRNVTALLSISGDSSRGQDIFRQFCQRCHGAAHTGTGRLSSRVSVIPEDTIAAFPTNARAVVVEKVRHGKFYNIGGVMPLYSLEAISDQEIADILAYLGL